jgi:hypothetical protein
VRRLSLQRLLPAIVGGRALKRVPPAPAGTPNASSNAAREVVSCGDMPQKSHPAMKTSAPIATTTSCSEETPEVMPNFECRAADPRKIEAPLTAIASAIAAKSPRERRIPSS